MTITETAARSRHIVQEFFRLLGPANDMDAFLELMSPDITVDTPLAPKGEPVRFEGLEEVDRRFGDARRPMRSLDFYDLDILATEDPERFVATCRSRGELADGKKYKNAYCWIFRIRAGKILWWCEYYDPQEVLAIR